MIFQHHLIKTILQGTLVTLFVLICISAFLTFVKQLDIIGTNDYGFYEAFIYVMLKIPGQVVFSLPISVFIGAILSLGALASNNEIVVMQASGMSIRQLVWIVFKAALIIAIISLVMQQWVVSETEASASQGRLAAQKGIKNYSKSKSVWIKEGNRIIHVSNLKNNGAAKDIQIFELDSAKRLSKALRAKSAESTKGGWVLTDVYESNLLVDNIKTQFIKTLVYPGQLSVSLLQSMRVTPIEMSLTDLYQYQEFLGFNGLENEAEQIMFWRRMYSPLTILITCTLAIPFILGSQRGGQAGQRIMLGIMVGLSFVAIERVVVGVCQYLGITPSISTLIPLLIFLGFNVFLMNRVVNKKE
jgi:lipopolysaccharide export system permease protein